MVEALEKIANNEVMGDYKSGVDLERAYKLELILERHRHIWNWGISEWSDTGVSTFENVCGFPTYLYWQGRRHQVLTREGGADSGP